MNGVWAEQNGLIYEGSELIQSYGCHISVCLFCDYSVQEKNLLFLVLLILHEPDIFHTKATLLRDVGIWADKWCYCLNCMHLRFLLSASINVCLYHKTVLVASTDCKRKSNNDKLGKRITLCRCCICSVCFLTPIFVPHD